MGPGVLDRRVEEGRRDALAGATRRETTKQTIDQTGMSSSGARTFEDGEPLVVLARREADPADGAVVPIRDEPGRQVFAW